MPNKKVLSFDLDNVIRDSVGQVCTLAKHKYGIQLYRDQFNVWDPALGHLLGISEEEFIQFAWCNEEVFKNAMPMPDAVRVMKSLKDDAIFIINTSNQFPNITTKWLRYWDVPFHKVIHTNNKLEVDFDIHVDDSPVVLEALHNAGRKVIRFASVPWNNHLNGKYPVANNWLELRNLLKES
jgi:5'(3')-deoxyribonucleotidase